MTFHDFTAIADMTEVDMTHDDTEQVQDMVTDAIAQVVQGSSDAAGFLHRLALAADPVVTADQVTLTLNDGRQVTITVNVA